LSPADVGSGRVDTTGVFGIQEGAGTGRPGGLRQDVRELPADPLGLDREDGQIVTATVGATPPTLQAGAVESGQPAGGRINPPVEGGQLFKRPLRILHAGPLPAAGPLPLFPDTAREPAVSSGSPTGRPSRLTSTMASRAAGKETTSS
jgi:hypothetical protein